MENNNTLVENDIPLGAKYNRNLKNTEKRILWVDYLKAFACLLVVLGHLLQSFQRANIDFNLELTTFINWFIYLFHMPVFMCMSGYLYCKKRKEFSWNNYKKFELKKIINLLIPYFTFYLITIGLNMLFSGSVNNKMGIQELKNIINNPISPYWFLYALLSIYIVIPILEKSLKNNKNAVFIVLIVLKVISIFINTNIYFLDSIMEYSIYFYLGNYIVDTNKLISTKKVII